MRDAVVDIRIRAARADAFAKKYLKTAARFAMHLRSREHGRHIDDGGGDPSTRFRSAFADAKKSLRRATDFAPQHPICAKSRAVPTLDETR